MTISSAYGGATQSQDPARDCWRTPGWIAAWVRKQEGGNAIFDLACTHEDRLFDHGIDGGDALAQAWPEGVLFCNPPFSCLLDFAARIRNVLAQPVPRRLYYVCPFRPETAWFKVLTHDVMLADAWISSVRTRVGTARILGWQNEADEELHVRIGVLDHRVRFDPPAGIAESSPSGWTALAVFDRKVR